MARRKLPGHGSLFVSWGKRATRRQAVCAGCVLWAQCDSCALHSAGPTVLMDCCREVGIGPGGKACSHPTPRGDTCGSVSPGSFSPGVSVGVELPRASFCVWYVLKRSVVWFYF